LSSEHDKLQRRVPSLTIVNLWLICADWSHDVSCRMLNKIDMFNEVITAQKRPK
jgi:hypothetical protein